VNVTLPAVAASVTNVKMSARVPVGLATVVALSGATRAATWDPSVQGTAAGAVVAIRSLAATIPRPTVAGVTNARVLVTTIRVMTEPAGMGTGVITYNTGAVHRKVVVGRL